MQNNHNIRNNNKSVESEIFVSKCEVHKKYLAFRTRSRCKNHFLYTLIHDSNI